MQEEMQVFVRSITSKSAHRYTRTHTHTHTHTKNINTSTLASTFNPIKIVISLNFNYSYQNNIGTIKIHWLRRPARPLRHKETQKNNNNQSII